MSKYFGTTVDDIFNSQDKRFRAEGAAGMNAVFAYDIQGEGGGRWKLAIKDNTCATEKLEGDEFGDYSVKIMTDAETFVGVTVGKIDGTEAFMGGRLKVDGQIPLMMELPKLFTKYTPPQKELTAADILGTAEARFRPENAEGLDITVGYDLAGDGGGKWTAVIKDGKCALEQGLRDNLTVCNIVKAQDFVDLMLGRLDPMVAFGAGRLRLIGDMEIAQRLPKIFGKYVAKATEPAEELIMLKRTISVDMKYSTGPAMGKFLDGLKEKKILANVCPKCGRRQLPPRESCAVCLCSVDDFVEVGPDGIATFCDIIYYASPDPLTGEIRETPYGALFVLLDGCKGRETLWHLLKDEDIADIERGDRVRAVWAEHPTGSVHDILYFEKVR